MASELVSQLHSMRGAAATLGAIELPQSAKLIEQQLTVADPHAWPTLVTPLLDMHSGLCRLVANLERALSQSSPTVRSLH